MFTRRWFRAVLLATVGSLALTASTSAAEAPSPVAANGNPVQAVATGIPTPTSFAFAGSTIFAGSGPTEFGGPGGLFVLSAGKASKVAGAPSFVFGLAWRKGILYVSTGPKIVALSGWNGTTFSAQKTIYKGKKKGFPGFNGLAFGPNGRLYAGLALPEDDDHTKDPYPISQGVVSMTAAGKDLRLLARGLRQPFQLTFPRGSHNPYVSVLGQDQGKTPRDQIVVAKSGQNYGFPTCIWLVGQACKKFDKPLIFLPKHASPMGISSIGSKLYVALYGGTGNGPEVVTIPTKGGVPTPLVTGFPAPIVGLNIDKGIIYVGCLNETIYEVAA